MEKLHRIAEYTLNNLQSAIDAGMIVHDVDLQKWGIHAKNILGFDDTRFKAFDWWVWSFKRTHRIRSRKINKSITRKTLKDKEKLKVSAENFVNEMKPYITQYGTENVYNLDQSGFQLEMHSAGKNMIPMIIPKGTTGKVQPLDVYGFRIWKNYV